MHEALPGAGRESPLWREQYGLRPRLRRRLGAFQKYGEG